MKAQPWRAWAHECNPAVFPPRRSAPAKTARGLSRFPPPHHKNGRGLPHSKSPRAQQRYPEVPLVFSEIPLICISR